MPKFMHPPTNQAERYDCGLRRLRNSSTRIIKPRPAPSKDWPRENVEFLERYCAWLLSGGISEMVVRIYHVMMAGYVLGLNLKPYHQLDPDQDFACALAFVKIRSLSQSWNKNCERSLAHLRRFLRLERGLGEESKVTPFDSKRVTQGLPAWLVSELERFQRIYQRNWRTARMQENIRRFWSTYLRIWHFFVEERNVRELKDLKRQHVLDYVDKRLSAGYSVSGVNNDLRELHTFLLFLQEEGSAVPNSLLRIRSLKQPEPLPRYLTDEQVKRLCHEVELQVAGAKLASRRRAALLIRATFYLLWQGGLRLGEVEELRLEDLELPHRRISVRDGKGRKDRTVYLAPTAVHVLEEYLEVRGQGTGDHVFLYRNSPIKKDYVRTRLKEAGERVGVKVYPHRLRHTCATQLLNAGCRITSIQRFLGHKSIGSTMIYAKAHDATVAEDYFAAMERVEQRLELTPAQEKGKEDEVVKVQDNLFELIGRLETPELCLRERLSIAEQLRRAFGRVHEYAPPRIAVPE